MTRLMVSRLGRDPSHRKHMFRTMVTQLFKHERIKTTLPKAMALRFPADRMITLAKTNTLQNALQLSKKYLREKDVVFKLLSVLKLRYLLRNGGYTRVHKCGFRKFDKAPMAYIELVDGPKEIGKRIEKRPKVYPTIEELREKAPTMEIYNKPVLHVSENKRTSLLGGMVTLMNRLRTIPIPTVSDLAGNLLTPPDLSIEFANLPGPGQPREKEAHAMVEKSTQDIKKHAQEVLAQRKLERKEERTRLRKELHMNGTHKQKGAAAAKDGETKGETKGEAKGEAKAEERETNVEEIKSSEATGDKQQANQQQQQPQQNAKPQGNQHQNNKKYQYKTNKQRGKRW